MSRLGIGTRISVTAAGGAAALVLAALVAGRVAGADHEDWRRYRDRAERYQAAYEELESTLDRVERVAQRGRFGRNGYQIQHIITAGRARAAEALHERRRDGDGDFDRRPDLRPDRPWGQAASPMNAREFATLREAVRTAGYAETQLQLVQAAAAQSWFTVDQTIELLGVIGFADTQVEVAVALRPRLVDATEWYRVYQALPYQSSREELRRRVGQ